MGTDRHPEAGRVVADIAQTSDAGQGNLGTTEDRQFRGDDPVCLSNALNVAEKAEHPGVQRYTWEMACQLLTVVRCRWLSKFPPGHLLRRKESMST